MDGKEELILLENIIIIAPNCYRIFEPLPRRLEKDADYPTPETRHCLHRRPKPLPLCPRIFRLYLP